MKKLNKKGFTLVEMLVVIAIIAVLVAIIVPTTSSATNKAKAAANAANLRSIKAEIGIAILQEDTQTITVAQDGKTVTVGNTTLNVPAAKTIGSNDTVTFKAGISNGEVIVQYGAHTVNDYATYAETGSNLGSNGTLS